MPEYIVYSYSWFVEPIFIALNDYEPFEFLIVEFNDLISS